MPQYNKYLVYIESAWDKKRLQKKTIYATNEIEAKFTYLNIYGNARVEEIKVNLIGTINDN
jgi:hypothetical protein